MNEVKIYDVNTDQLRPVTQRDVSRMMEWQRIAGQLFLSPGFANHPAVISAKQEWQDYLANEPDSTQGSDITVESFILANKDLPHVLALRPAVLVETKVGYEVAIFEGTLYTTIPVDGDDLYVALRNLSNAVSHDQS